ncbi:hypothetical protein QBC39DRAFT_381450 [Podospora conica]|nr:hypothetical protein QBC39DRAFT_381450 [Schizothecium conicum]
MFRILLIVHVTPVVTWPPGTLDDDEGFDFSPDYPLDSDFELSDPDSGSIISGYSDADSGYYSGDAGSLSSSGSDTDSDDSRSHSNLDGSRYHPDSDLWTGSDFEFDYTAGSDWDFDSGSDSDPESESDSDLDDSDPDDSDPESDSDNGDDGGDGHSRGDHSRGDHPGKDHHDNDDHDSFIDTHVAAAIEYAHDPLFFEAQLLSDPAFGPIPGQTPLFTSNADLAPTWPGNITHPILPTIPGPPHPDDRTWQNLLSAEWLIFNFYQTAITTFTPASFTAAGFPAHTFSRLLEIRNNEAGHLRLFQAQISPHSIKPGACRYAFPFSASDPHSFLALLTVLEISSMAFLTGLVQQPTTPSGRGAMLAIAETETRHEVWALMDVWGANPFAGPSDTVFPYADEVLDSTSAFIVPGSCPRLNPEYPTPRRGLPALSAGGGTVSLAPGARISLEFGGGRQPVFERGRGYFAVFFHGMGNVTIPAEFERGKGVVVAVVADERGAPTRESLVAGPAIILEQPERVGLALLKAGAEKRAA